VHCCFLLLRIANCYFSLKKQSDIEGWRKLICQIVEKVFGINPSLQFLGKEDSEFIFQYLAQVLVQNFNFKFSFNILFILYEGQIIGILCVFKIFFIL
jgi:hypothetical protein